jgi:hypothetical protein
MNTINTATLEEITRTYLEGEVTADQAMDKVVVALASSTQPKIEVTFKKRTAQQVTDKVTLNDSAVPTVKTTYDFSDLTEEQVLMWAVRGVTIHVQAQMKSGALKDDALDNKTFKVPEPGDRKRLTDTDKLRRLVAELLKKEEKDVTLQDIMDVTKRITG